MANKYEGAIEKLSDYQWRLPRDTTRGMLTDGIVYADEVLFRDLRDDAALWQVANVACMLGIVGASMAMPDCHYGYGFPIGGVAAFDVEEGVISPGGVGYDINCGVRLLRTNLTEEDVRPRIKQLADQIFRDVPAGVGGKGDIDLSDKQLDEVLVKGAGWAVGQGYGTQDDLDATEAGGCLPGADPLGLSDRARKRGRPQLATLGSGNHFLELQVVDEISSPGAAEVMGLTEPGQVTVMIHCGSRGFGHQVCDDAIEVMQHAVAKYGISLPDRQLACAPIRSVEGEQYYAHMACAANYAWANRQAITHNVCGAFERVFGQGRHKLGLVMVWDVAHNIAKFERHEVAGAVQELCVHRKGATRAFGPGDPELPARYREIGQPVIVPGDMGTASWVLVGTEQAMSLTWGSTCHGAGRQLSRSAARKRKHGKEVIRDLEQQGIHIRAAGTKTVAEEMPEAYKDVDRVVEVCHGAGISRKVARLRPLAVIKG